MYTSTENNLNINEAGRKLQVRDADGIFFPDLCLLPQKGICVQK